MLKARPDNRVRPSAPIIQRKIIVRDAEDSSISDINVIASLVARRTTRVDMLQGFVIVPRISRI
jgi:hypothetical protein